MMELIPDTLQKELFQLIDKECWYVSTYDSSFSLALGKKVPRRILVKSMAHSHEFQENKGEENLLVWCSWRLDSEEKPVTSSDEDGNTIETALDVLVGKKIVSVDIESRAWDLDLNFNDGLQLRIFCDHVPGNPSYNGNWELSHGNVRLFAGPGYEWKKEAEDGSGEQYLVAARGILNDLASIGFEVESIWELRLIGEEYSKAVPILMRWLPRVQERSVRNDIIRALSVPWAKEALPMLLVEFELEKNTWNKWSLGNAIENLADDAAFERVASLVKNSCLGEARQMLTRALAKMNDSRVPAILIELLKEEDMAGSALQALDHLHTPVPKSLLKPFLEHKKNWVRKEARKVLAFSVGE